MLLVGGVAFCAVSCEQGRQSHPFACVRARLQGIETVIKFLRACGVPRRQMAQLLRTFPIGEPRSPRCCFWAAGCNHPVPLINTVLAHTSCSPADYCCRFILPSSTPEPPAAEEGK